jgi:formiminoglutamate deiminase
VTAYWCEHAWLGDGAVAGVRVVEDDGRIVSVEAITDPAPGDARLPGLTLPGFANAHSHAFHRALRGRTHDRGGTFWTWRERMYAVAARLDPDSYLALARATYAEMALAGVTCVGEFHYLHHPPGGGRYDDPNAMSEALIQAAADAGVRLTVLDACYLAGGLDGSGHLPLDDVQLRFSDGDADGWAARVARLSEGPGVRVGAAIHSVRAVPAEQLPTVAEWAGDDQPLHVHLSEQVAENQASVAAYDRTPTEVLADQGILGPMTSAVHATHLTDEDMKLLGDTRTYACFCPTTERDLGDGIGPSRQLHERGSLLTLGSDSHAVIDLFEEMRAVELDERLATRERGHWTAAELLTAATTDGQASLGYDDAGSIAVGRRADLVTLDTTTPRTAGTGRDEHTAVFAAGAADVVRVMSDGRVVYEQGDETEIGRALDGAIGRLWT